MWTAGHRQAELAHRTTDLGLTSAVDLLALGLEEEVRSQNILWSVGTLGVLSLLGWVISIAMTRESPGLDRATLILTPGLAALMIALDGLGRVTPWTLLVLAVLVGGLALLPCCRPALADRRGPAGTGEGHGGHLAAGPRVSGPGGAPQGLDG
jgi:hypothetical protein